MNIVAKKENFNYNDLQDKLAIGIYLDGCYKKRKFITDYFCNINYNSLINTLNREMEDFFYFCMKSNYPNFSDSEIKLYFDFNNKPPNFNKSFDNIQIAYEIFCNNFPVEFLNDNEQVEVCSYYLLLELCHHFFEPLDLVYNSSLILPFTINNLYSKCCEYYNKFNFNLGLIRNLLQKENFKIYLQIFNSKTKTNHINNFCKFSKISNEYGYFISYLTSPLELPNLNLINKIDYKQIPYFFTTPKFINLFMGLNEFHNLDKAKAQHAYNAISKLFFDIPLMNYEKNWIVYLIKKGDFFDKLKKSYKNRMIGIWIWDKYKNPLLNNHQSLSDIIKELYNMNIYFSSSFESFERQMKKNLKNTCECIENGAIIPFKN